MKLDVLLGALPPEVSVVSPGRISARVELELNLPNGEQRVFRLEVSCDDLGQINVSECAADATLPRFCPERHIVGNGAFCLELSSPDQPRVTGDDAVDWWRVLIGFLRMQVVADDTGRWPHGMGLAHGDAVEWQLLAEYAGLVIAPGLARAAATLKRTAAGNRIQNRRQSCPCDSGETIKNCHEAELLGLMAMSEFRARAEDEFWAAARARHTCCRTMLGCPLADPE